MNNKGIELFDSLPFSQAIAQIDAQRLDLFRVKTFTLDTARSNEKIAISGNFFYVIDATDSNVVIDIRLNSLDTNSVTMSKGLGLQSPFKVLFLTNSAQAGKTVTIIYGVEAPKLLSIIDNRSQAQSTTVLETIRDEMTGDTVEENFDTEKTVGTSAVSILALNSDRKKAFVQSKSDNTGIIYIGFTSSVTSSKWAVELQPEDGFLFEAFRGTIYAISDTAGQKLGYFEV